MIDLAHRDEALSVQPVQALERTHHQVGAAQGDAGNLTAQALFLREMSIDLGRRKTEDAVVRSTPDRTFAVVVQLGDTVGAESVIDVDPPNFPALRIDGDHAVGRRGQQRAVLAQTETLINLDFIPTVHDDPAQLSAGQNARVAAINGRIYHANGIPFHRLNPSRHVDTLKIDRPVRLQTHAYHAGDVGRMDNPPFYIVIDQKALEIREEGVPLTVTDYVEVAVVGIVLAGRVVLEERHAHIGVSAMLRNGRHREKHHGDRQHDMIR